MGGERSTDLDRKKICRTAMKNFLSRWQGLWALLIFLGGFTVTPMIMRLISPTSGQIDGAYVHGLIFTALVFFMAIFCGWLAMQMDWSILDRYIDTGAMKSDWKGLSPLARIIVFFLTIFFLISLFAVCYFSLPKP